MTALTLGEIEFLHAGQGTLGEVANALMDALTCSELLMCGSQMNLLRFHFLSPLVDLTYASLEVSEFARAGILQFPAGHPTLTLSRNLPARQLFERIGAKLAQAA